MATADACATDKVTPVKLRREQQRTADQRHKWKHGAARRTRRAHDGLCHTSGGCWGICSTETNGDGVRPARHRPEAHRLHILERGSTDRRHGRIVNYRASNVPRAFPAIRSDLAAKRLDDVETESYYMEPAFNADDETEEDDAYGDVPRSFDHPGPSDGAHALGEALDRALERYETTVVQRLLKEYDILELESKESTHAESVYGDDFELV